MTIASQNLTVTFSGGGICVRTRLRDYTESYSQGRSVIAAAVCSNLPANQPENLSSIAHNQAGLYVWVLYARSPNLDRYCWYAYADSVVYGDRFNQLKNTHQHQMTQLKNTHQHQMSNNDSGADCRHQMGSKGMANLNETARKKLRSMLPPSLPRMHHPQDGVSA